MSVLSSDCLRRARKSMAVWVVASLTVFIPRIPVAQEVPEEAMVALCRTAVMINCPEIGFCGTGTILQGGGRIATNMDVGGQEARRTKVGPGFTQDLTISCAGRVEDRVQVSLLQRESHDQDVCTFDVRSFPHSEIDWGAAGYVRYEDLAVGTKLYTLGNRGCRPWTFSSGRLIAKLDRRATNLDEVERFDRIQSTLPEIEGVWWNSYDRLYVAEGTLTGRGNSGGPIVDSSGRLVAIAFAGTQAYSFLIPGAHVYSRAGVAEPETAGLADQTTSLSALGAPRNDSLPTPRPLPPLTEEQVARALSDVAAMELQEAVTYTFLTEGEIRSSSSWALLEPRMEAVVRATTGGDATRRPAAVRVRGDVRWSEVAFLELEEPGRKVRFRACDPASADATSSVVNEKLALIVKEDGVVLFSLASDSSANSCRLNLVMRSRSRLPLVWRQEDM